MNRWLSEEQVINPDRERSIVMLHGFIGSPFDLKPLVDGLEMLDCRIVLPLLPSPKDDGQNTIDAAREIIQQHQPDSLVGFSMGGALSFLLSDMVEKVVLIAPYFGLPRADQLATRSASWLYRFIPRIPKFSSGRIADKVGRLKYSPGAYSFETRSFMALQQIAQRARNGTVSRPTLWAHAPKDPVAGYRVAQRYLSAATEHLSLPDAHHVLLYDYGHEKIIRRVQAFLLRECTQTH